MESIIQLAKADRARDTIKKTEVLLEPLLIKVINFYQKQYSAKNLTVKTDLLLGDRFVQADARLLLFAIRNLVQNAFEYTPPDETISISTRAEPDGITVTISNTGASIPKDRLPFIFERFFRVDESRSRERGGAGIGLAIVKGFIEAHNGRVGAESDQNRTSVWFFLPA